MSKRIFASAFALLLATFGCNDIGTCPSPDSITPGGSCSGESLECPYTLQTASPACDGTTVEGGLATSCVCTKGIWSCALAVSCPEAGPAGDDGATGDDGASADDGGNGDGS